MNSNFAQDHIMLIYFFHKLYHRVETKVKLTLLLADPENAHIVNLIVLGRGPERANTEGVRGSITELVQRFGHLANSTPIYVPYASSNYVYFADPQSEKGQVLALDANFQGENIGYAPMVYIAQKQNPIFYDYYYQDFLRLKGIGRPAVER